MWGWHGAGGQAGGLFEPLYGRGGVLIRISVPGLQEAAYHPEVSADVRQRALRFGRECADGYLELLEHVLVVSVPRLLFRGLLRLPLNNGVLPRSPSSFGLCRSSSL